MDGHEKFRIFAVILLAVGLISISGSSLAWNIFVVLFVWVILFHRVTYVVSKETKEEREANRAPDKLEEKVEEIIFLLQWVESNKISVVFDGAQWAIFRNDSRADSGFVSPVEISRNDSLRGALDKAKELLGQ